MDGKWQTKKSMRKLSLCAVHVCVCRWARVCMLRPEISGRCLPTVTLDFQTGFLTESGDASEIFLCPYSQHGDYRHMPLSSDGHKVSSSIMFLLNWELVHLARLAGQRAIGIQMSLPPWLCVYRHKPPYLALLWRLRLELWFLHLYSKYVIHWSISPAPKLSLLYELLFMLSRDQKKSTT